MDRRATLSTLLGRKKKQTAQKKTTAAMTLGSGLSPYSGAWGYAQAAHLLRRSTFGATNAQIKQAVADGMAATISKLFSDQPMPDPPVNYYFRNDPNVPIGSTWVDQPYSAQTNFANYRRRSLFAWTFGLLLNEGISIREKMTLFWHNHFVTENINDPKFKYVYISLLRENALSNFKRLVKKITIDPSMLLYLNGNQNSRRAPNENYARELFELFTIGKGELAGPGDYTTFTEDDVVEAARVLTGWVVQGYLGAGGLEPTPLFVQNRHDITQKKLSHRFNNAIINDNGQYEYGDLVDIIFQQEEVSRFICRKFYRWFVYYDINEEVEMNVIEPMAQMLRDNDFEVKPVLEALLQSEHFYDPACMGAMIKNPLDFMVGLLRQSEVKFSEDVTPKYLEWLAFFGYTDDLQMVYFIPPNVAGWKAYYQEPSYYQFWINSTTLSKRLVFTDALTQAAIVIGQNVLKIDVLDFISKLDDALDVNNMIDEITNIFLPMGVTEAQRDALKELLIPGLPDYEWTIEYSNYLGDPSDEELKQSVERKLQSFMKTLFSMAEIHLS
ncbi:MAG: DUF1800 domain-containing protein [Bacteroidota bacterium]